VTVKQSRIELLLFFFIVVVAMVISCAKPALTPAPSPAPPPMPTGRLPLIDAHVHLPRELTLDYLIKLMDETGVQMAVLMPVFFSGQNQGISDENLILEYYKKKPDRIIPFLGMQRDALGDKRNWEDPARVAGLLQFAESRLRTGLFRGMGEFILWHYAYSVPVKGRLIKIPADTPLMKKFLDLATKYHVPITVHYEIDEESLPSLKKMLDYGNRATIILAHNGGRPDPPTLKALLDEYPNLFCDWAGMTYLGLYGRTSGEYKKNPVDDGTGHLRPEWKNIFEQYSDRFVGMGSDLAHPENWRNPKWQMRQIAAFRSLLSDLSPGTAEKIGYRNALKIFSPDIP
jgi:hypothetical protein